MENYRKDLLIDRDNLDEEVIKQPTLFDHYAQMLVPLYKERDGLKLGIEQLSAQLDGVLREGASARGEKMTETKLQGEITNNPQLQNLNLKYINICTEVKEREAIRDAFQQKKDMLKLLIELYIAGYWASVQCPVVRGKTTEILQKKLEEKMKEDRK